MSSVIVRAAIASDVKVHVHDDCTERNPGPADRS